MRAVLGAAAAVLSAPLLPAQPVSESPDRALQAQADQLDKILTDSAATQAQRDDAARRLASRSSPLEHAVLARELTSGNHDAELAVARALEDASPPDPQLLESLARLLGTERSLHEAAARALSRYTASPAARDRLIAFARDGRQSPGPRSAAVNALGAFVDRQAAQALLDLLSDEKQPMSVRNAAGDALVDMTGILANDRDPRPWRQWMSAGANRADADWKNDVYAGRTARLQQVEHRQQRLATELSSLLTEQYQGASKDQKNAIVMRYLGSAEPDIRSVGAQIVRDALLAGLPYPTEAPARLKDLVGDGDTKVRLEVARALGVLAYAPALDALLNQLAVEQDPDVKMALVGALTTIGDVRAVPDLRSLLHDPSVQVAVNAAGALKQLGKTLREANPQLAGDTAQELWRIVQDRAGQPAGAEFKAAALEALAVLRDDRRTPDLIRLLNLNETEQVRSAALHALRELGDKHTDDAIAQWLQREPRAGVRLDAIDALGTTGTFEADAKALYNQTKPEIEPENAVRERSWKIFELLLATATDVRSLVDWSQQLFRDNDWQHRLDVLKVLDARLLQARQLEPLAVYQQSTGEAYMHLNRPEEAATYFRKALDYYINNHVANQVTEQLVSQLMGALLKSKQYDAAIKFASDTITDNAPQQQTMGALIRDEADLQKRADPAGAVRLINGALNMKPQLGNPYREDLLTIKAEIEKSSHGEKAP